MKVSSTSHASSAASSSTRAAVSTSSNSSSAAKSSSSNSNSSSASKSSASSSNASTASKSSSSSSNTPAKTTSSLTSKSTEVKGMAKVDSSSQKQGISESSSMKPAVNRTNNTASSANTVKSSIESAVGAAFRAVTGIANGNTGTIAKQGAPSVIVDNNKNAFNITPVSASTGSAGGSSNNASSSSSSSSSNGSGSNSGTGSYSHAPQTVIDKAIAQTGGVSVVQVGNNGKPEARNLPNITVEVKKDTTTTPKPTVGSSTANAVNSNAKVASATTKAIVTAGIPATANKAVSTKNTSKNTYDEHKITINNVFLKEKDRRIGLFPNEKVSNQVNIGKKIGDTNKNNIGNILVDHMKDNIARIIDRNDLDGSEKHKPDFRITDKRMDFMNDTLRTEKKPKDTTKDQWKPIGLGLKNDTKAVMDIEKKLAALDYLNGSTNGVFDGNTKAAVEKFQKDNNLECTGVVDKKTMDILTAAYYLKNSPTPTPKPTPKPTPNQPSTPKISPDITTGKTSYNQCSLFGPNYEVSDYTFNYNGKNVTLKKYTFSEIGLTVYGCVDCDDALFNNDPIKAYQGYKDSIMSYDEDEDGAAIWDIESLKKVNHDAWWNKGKMWINAGVSALSDIVSIFKITKAAKAGEGMIKIYTDTLKSYVIPEDVFKDYKDLTGLTNRSIALYDATKAQAAGAGKRAMNYGISMTPIIGTAVSVYNAVTYNYKYAYKNDDHTYSKGHDYWWYED